MKNLRRLTGYTLFSFCLALSATAQDSESGQEDELIRILQSEEAPAQKAITCKKLVLYGTEKCVPVLAPLLADPELASWARIPLEAIPGPAPEAALRDAASGLEGRLLIGVLNSIGVRRDADAVTLLKGYLKNKDPGVISAAAVALGRIGGKQAEQALVATLGAAPEGAREAVAEGCILAAEQRYAGAAYADALELYGAVRDAKVSAQKTREAVRGVILSKRDQGLPLLADLLKSDDKSQFGLGLHVAREIPGLAVAKMLTDEWSRSAGSRRSALLLALTERGDPQALSIALQVAGGADAASRIYGIGILDKLGDPAAVKVLLKAAGDGDAGVRDAARKALARLPGAETEAALKQLLGDADANTRLLAVELLAQRRVEGLIPALLKGARDSDQSVRLASFKALNAMAEAEDVKTLLNLLVTGETRKDMVAAERAVVSVCLREARQESGRVEIIKALYGDLPDGAKKDVTSKVAELVKKGNLEVEATNGNFGDPAGGTVKSLRIDYKMGGKVHSKQVPENETLTLTVKVAPPECVDAVIGALSTDKVEAKQSLLRILGAFGGPQALEAVIGILNSSGAELNEIAFKTLCDWPGPEAIPDLADLARTLSARTSQILALRGYIRLIPEQDVPYAEKLAGLKEAALIASRPEETRLILAALGEIPTLESLAQVMPYLGRAEVKEEACAAVLAIAENAKGIQPESIQAALSGVLKASTNKQTINQANKLLKK